MGCWSTGKSGESGDIPITYPLFCHCRVVADFSDNHIPEGTPLEWQLINFPVALDTAIFQRTKGRGYLYNYRLMLVSRLINYANR